MQGEKDFGERDCMSLDGFCACVRLDIQKKLGHSFTVELKDITKNNATKLKALVIAEQGSNMHPTVYMEDFYEDYKEGKSLEEIENSILQAYQKSRGKQFDVAFFTDWQKVKERITYKLINYNSNRKLLKDIPHRKIFNLAVVYECFLGAGDAGGATILIRKKHLELWGITADELHVTAFRNTPELMGYSFSSIAKVVQEIVGGGEDGLEGLWGLEEAENNRVPLYVLTNRYKLHGAGCILYKNLLKRIAEKWGCDICILPSSIHEVILMPMDKAENYGDMSQIVREVNATQVAPEEILSDHVYQFNMSTGEIIMQEEKEYE